MKLSFLTLIIVVFFFATAQSFSQDNIEHIRNVLERDPYGVTPDIEIQGNYAYIAEEHHGLRIVDISNPQLPIEVGRLDAEVYGISLEIRDHYVLLVAMGGLLTIDIEDPESPVIVNTYELHANCPFANIILDDTIAYVKTIMLEERVGFFEEPLKILDISNILEPEEICIIENEDDFGFGKPGLAVYENILFDGNYYYDISNPDEPELIGHLDWPSISDFEIIDNILYCTSHFNEQFRIFDINDIENPRLLFSSHIIMGGMGIEIRDDLAYIAWSKMGIMVFDISEPENSHRIAQFNRLEWVSDYWDDDFGAYDIELEGDLAYIQTIDKGLRIVSISNIEEMYEISKLDGRAFVNDFVFSDDEIFIASGTYQNWGYVEGGLYVMQTENPVNPELIGAKFESKIYEKISKSGDKLFLNGYAHRSPTSLDVFDVSDPESPQLEATTEPFPRLGDIQILDNFMLTNYQNENVHYLAIFDVSDTDSIRLLNEIPTMSEIHAFDRDANRVCLANAEAGLRVFDLTNPEHFVFLGLLNLGDIAIDVKIYEDYAIVACLEEGVKFVDISNPEAAQVVNTYQPESNIIGLELHEDFVFLLEENNMIEVLNISDVNNPELLGIAETDAEPTNVAANGQILYVAQGLYDPDSDGPSSLGIYDCHGLLDVDNSTVILPGDCSLIDAFPNPFNSSLKINYTLPHYTNFRLSVFNINGKEVSVLGSGYKNSGDHFAQWNAPQSPSGLYFLKLEAENTVPIQRRIVLVR
ncbi:MAG: T9SS type A sorting domain-containing protein [Calditrichaeota bacterium]|nr:T9SS type A sorting domain-containing protein [Calditrichota bacterium]